MEAEYGPQERKSDVFVLVLPPATSAVSRVVRWRRVSLARTIFLRFFFMMLSRRSPRPRLQRRGAAASKRRVSAGRETVPSDRLRLAAQRRSCWPPRRGSRASAGRYA
jgi:hypothetical protein